MKNNITQNGVSPFIPASRSIPEITFRSIIIGTILTIILAAANAYLGLKLGQTVSASIPAAIIAMSILRFCRNSNVLENTMIQTMASVGESLIAGITFIMPALIILHVWSGFPYWQTVGIALVGGILGVLFTIPLRRALLADKTLRYPEGVAISNVLKANAESKTTDMKALTWGGIVGAVILFFQTGFQILTDTINFWVKTPSAVVGFQLGLSPALIASGYIVGINVAISFMVGITIGWLIGVPVLTLFYGMPDANSATQIAMSVWKLHIRYIGVGTMLVGGLWTLVSLFQPIVSSIRASLFSLQQVKQSGKESTHIRTERDIPINFVFWGVILLFIPLVLLIAYELVPALQGMSATFHLLICVFASVYVLIGGFLFCSVSAYFAGLIGSSNTPVSGLLISALLILCLGILAIFSFAGGMAGKESFGVLLAIGSSVVICVALAISNDTMQDLKVGQVVGATPWKQQLMLVMGVLISAFVVPPILDLLYNAYGIGGVFPRPGMNESQMLAAPQAGLMAAVAHGVYSQQLEWSMIIIGAILAIICIFIDTILQKTRGLRLPVLAVGLGIYLPMNATIPVVIGGLLSWIVEKRLRKLHHSGKNDEKTQKTIMLHRHRGLLLTCGLVAGASIMGVVLAIPFTLKQSSDALKIMPDQLQFMTGGLSLLTIALLCLWIYRTVMNKKIG